LKGIEFWDTHPYQNFKNDINNQYSYSYTFIEPNYGDVTNNTYSGGQSQHPMDDVRNGEALIKSTYETIRNSSLSTKSLLIIIYDEHGGFYDHFAPPAAISPGDTIAKYNQYGFIFQQYGVRVPALIISAYTPKNIIDHRTYDHSSVPATLEAMFNLPALTKRDAKTNDITSLASLKIARTDAPATLPDPVVISTVEMAFAQLKKEKLQMMQNRSTREVCPAFYTSHQKAK
jgi:phospholipase C